MTQQQVYYPMASVYYPPSAFGIPAAVPGLPVISQEQLLLAVRQQIEYYFSIANLVKDVFLRSKMNGEGWIALHVIASFNRVRMLTPDLAMIMEALADSTTVELSGDNLFIRPRQGYQQWILPEGQRDASAHALPHMPGNTSSNIMRIVTQQQQGAATTSLTDAAAAGSVTSNADQTSTGNSGRGQTGAEIAQNSQAQSNQATSNETTASQADAVTSSDKGEQSAAGAQEAGVADAAPSTPSNSKQERSASHPGSSSSPDRMASLLMHMKKSMMRMSLRWMRYAYLSTLPAAATFIRVCCKAAFFCMPAEDKCAQFSLVLFSSTNKACFCPKALYHKIMHTLKLTRPGTAVLKKSRVCKIAASFSSGWQSASDTAFNQFDCEQDVWLCRIRISARRQQQKLLQGMMLRWLTGIWLS